MVKSISGAMPRARFINVFASATELAAPDSTAVCISVVKGLITLEPAGALSGVVLTKPVSTLTPPAAIIE